MLKKKVCVWYSSYCGICAFVPPILFLRNMNHELDDLQMIFCIKLWRTFWLSDRITVFLSFSADILKSSLTTAVYDTLTWDHTAFCPQFVWDEICACAPLWLMPTSIQESRLLDDVNVCRSTNQEERNTCRHTLVSILIQSSVFFNSVPSFLYVAYTIACLGHVCGTHACL